MSACSQNDVCLEPQAIALRGGFYFKDSANLIQDTSLVNANLYFGANHSYFQNLKNISKFGFPLSQIQDSISIIFQSDSNSSDLSTVDTFQLIYERELHFISVACGYQTNYALKNYSTTHHLIDSLILASPQITNDINKEHIQIVIKK